MTMSKEPAGDDPRPAHDDPQAPDRADLVDRVDPASFGDRPAGVTPGADRPNTDDPDTHTAALQGAAAGGAMSGNAGYATGLLTGSQDNIGLRSIPDPADTSPLPTDAADVPPSDPSLPPGPVVDRSQADSSLTDPSLADQSLADQSLADADIDADAGSITPGRVSHDTA